MIDLLYCSKCDDQKEYYTELKSNQNTARCSVCNTFIKNVPYEKPKFYVGKYSGRAIDEIDDLGYLKWAVQNMKNIKGRTKEAINKQIAHLEFLAK